MRVELEKVPGVSNKGILIRDSATRSCKFRSLGRLLPEGIREQIFWVRESHLILSRVLCTQ
jgi:hypothetical protein